MISAAAVALSAFARAGDRLWTPAPVDPARVPDATGVELVSGPLEPAAEVLAWGETEEVARLRPEETASPLLGDWRDALWQHHPSADAARRCNHRAFGHELARALNVSLPGARMIAKPAELDAHLAAGGAAESATGTWIVKAPYSAAGRERMRHRGAEPMSGDARTRLMRLLARGPLLFEPWVERLAEVATAGVIGASEHLLLPTHRLETDAAGVFRGIVVGGVLGFSADELQTVRTTAHACAGALATAGYRGAFGVDAYAYRGADGARRLAALGEINARLTFGHVAHAHAPRINGPSRFVLGRGAAPAGAVPIVVAADDEPTAAWVEPA